MIPHSINLKTAAAWIALGLVALLFFALSPALMSYTLMFVGLGMAVAANQVTKRQDGCMKKAPVAASTTIYEGTLVFTNATGYADDDTASGVNRFAGVARDQVDNSSGSAGDKYVELWTDGVFRLVGSGFTQADVQKDVYASDNYTITTTPGPSAVRIGKCEQYISTTVLAVKIDPQQLGTGFTRTTEANTETLAGTKTLVVGDLKMQILDPGGAGRDVVLPAVASSKDLMFIVRNSADAAEVLTIKDAAAATICTPTQNETAFVWCDGAAWYGLVSLHN